MRTVASVSCAVMPKKTKTNNEHANSISKDENSRNFKFYCTCTIHTTKFTLYNKLRKLLVLCKLFICSVLEMLHLWIIRYSYAVNLPRDNDIFGNFTVTSLHREFRYKELYALTIYFARTSEQRIGSGIGKSSDSRTSPPKKVCTKQR